MAESRPPFFFNFRGGLLSAIFSECSKCLKTAISTFSPYWGFRVKISVSRHFKWFFEKMEENRPPLKVKINGSTF